MRIVLWTLLMALFFTGGLRAEDAAQTPPPSPSVSRVQDFDQYVRILLQSHPEVLALRAAADAKGNVPSQEYSLPNPQVSAGVENLPVDSLDFTKEDMTMKTIGVTQAFPASGKRELRRKVAEDEAAIAVHAVGEKRLELVEMARLAFYELRYLLKVRETVSWNIEILRGFIDVVIAKYSVGEGIQQDVLAAQLEFSKMGEYLIGLDQRVATISRNLNMWAGLPPNTDWSNPSIKPLGEIAEPEDKLVEIAVANRPAFRQLELALKKAEDGADLARRELSPDYAVKFSYGQRDNGPMRRSDVVSAEVMFDIPLYHKTKQDKMISQSLLEADKMRLDIEAERLKLRRDIAELMEVQRKNEKLVDLYNTRLLPQAQQSVDAALSAYRVNKVDFRWLVMNQITLFNYQLQKFQIEYDLQTMRARLLRALGGNNSEVENGY